MEKLIEGLIIRLEEIEKNDELQIIENKKENNEKVILFLSGKITAIKLCVDELRSFLKYHNRI